MLLRPWSARHAEIPASFDLPQGLPIPGVAGFQCKIEAKFHHGVLTVSVPTSGSQRLTQKVEVKAA